MPSSISRYSATVTVDAIERPAGWVSVSIVPGDYYYGSGGVRGVFRADDEEHINFIQTNLPTVLMLDRLNREAQAAEDAAAEIEQ